MELSRLLHCRPTLRSSAGGETEEGNQVLRWSWQGLSRINERGKGVELNQLAEVGSGHDAQNKLGFFVEDQMPSREG